MLAKINSLGLHGLDGYAVDVEVDVLRGMSRFDIVGMVDTAIKEAKERVQAGISNSGYEFPVSKITVNLAPASMRKIGSYYDLPIAVGILEASDQVARGSASGYVMVGELSLDGRIREVNGIMALIVSGRINGFTKFIIPRGNVLEASYIDGIELYSFDNLGEVASFLNGQLQRDREPIKSYEIQEGSGEISNDFKYVKGQKVAKRAMEISASGGHNILLVGPPGMGKTMLAKCMPSILPSLSFNEVLDVTKIYSIAGLVDGKTGIVSTRPFRSPHHTATTAALCGGGSNSKPGEVSLANHGVLFLDELPEYNRAVLESLRQPLEDRKITIARANQSVEYPCNFMLMASMNPCPCGNFGSSKRTCKCTRSAIHKYIGKLSGPLIDRIDIQVEVDSIDYDEINNIELSEPSCEIKKRVDKARAIQSARYGENSNKTNADMSEKEMNKYCTLDKMSDDLLKQAFDSLNMSVRGRSRIIKVARTIADLDNSTDIRIEHIAEAINYRMLDRKYWEK